MLNNNKKAIFWQYLSHNIPTISWRFLQSIKLKHNLGIQGSVINEELFLIHLRINHWVYEGCNCNSWIRASLLLNMRSCILTSCRISEGFQGSRVRMARILHLDGKCRIVSFCTTGTMVCACCSANPQTKKWTLEVKGTIRVRKTSSSNSGGESGNWEYSWAVERIFQGLLTQLLTQLL